MQLNSVSDNNTQDAAKANVTAKHGGNTQRYLWLLPLMATATLGFGMESLEEQYHTSTGKSSGWTFKGLFGFGKQKQSTTETPGSSGNSPIVKQTEQSRPVSQPTPPNATSSRGLNVVQNNTSRTPSLAPQPANEWNFANDTNVEEPAPKKKGFLAWFGRRDKTVVTDVEAPSPIPQESYEMQNTRQARAMEPTRQSANFGNMATVERGPQNFQSPQMMAAERLPADKVDEAPKKRGFWARLFGKKSQLQKQSPRASPREAVSGGSPDIDAQQPEKRKGFWARLFSLSKKKTQSTDDIEMGKMNTQDDQIARVGRVKSGSPQLMQGPNRRTSAVGAIVGPNARQQQTPQQWQQTIPEYNEAEFDEPPKPKKKRGLFTRSRAKKAVTVKNKNKDKGKGKAAQKTDGEWENIDEQRHEMTPRPPTQPKPARVKKYGAVVGNSEGLAQQHVTGPRQKERGRARTGAAAVNPKNWFWMDVYWK